MSVTVGGWTNAEVVRNIYLEPGDSVNEIELHHLKNAKPYIAGRVLISQQLLDQTRATEDAFARHTQRLMDDPEYADNWDASVDWDLVGTGHEDW